MVLIAITCNTKCPFSSEEHCVNGKLEDLNLAFRQLTVDHSLIWFAIAFILSCTLFNGFGNMVT